MRVRKHFTIVYLSEVQLRAELWLILLALFLILNFINLLIEDNDRLGPLVWLNRVFSREFFELLKNCGILLHLLRKLQHAEPSTTESVFVQVLLSSTALARKFQSLPQSS